MQIVKGMEALPFKTKLFYLASHYYLVIFSGPIFMFLFFLTSTLETHSIQCEIQKQILLFGTQ